MKLMDYLLLDMNGTPVEITDCSRSDFPQFLKEMKYSVGVEIGVYRGGFTEKLCKAGLKIYGIDPWLAYSGAGRVQKEQAVHDDNYNYTKELLAPYDCTLIRQTSMDALQHFKDGSLDFVYIDGDHSFAKFAADLVEWTKKVKSGGIISGHDYFNSGPEANNLICHVKAVVDAYTNLFGINPWYIFSQKDKTLEPSRVERVPNFMWIKK